MNIQQYRYLLEQEKGRQKAIFSAIKEKEAEVNKNKKEIIYIEEALNIAQQAAQQTQNEIKFAITELVTLAIETVYGKKYQFDIKFNIQRGKTEAYLCFLKDGEDIDPMSSTGGGVINVAAFALRIALWNLKRDRARNTIVLDEPAGKISKDLQPLFGSLIKEISNKLNIQFIIVSHEKALAKEADKIFKVSYKNKESFVEEIEYEG